MIDHLTTRVPGMAAGGTALYFGPMRFTVWIPMLYAT
jgi:hypothetical protein